MVNVEFSRAFPANSAPIAVTGQDFFPLLVPVLTVIRLISARPPWIVRSDLRFGHPFAVTFVATKATVCRFFTALFTGVGLNRLECDTHAGRRAISFIVRRLAANFAWVRLDDALSFSHTFAGAKSLVFVRLSADFARSRFFKGLVGASFRAISFIRRRNWIPALRANFGLVGFSGFMIALKRAIGLGGWLPANWARSYLAFHITFIRAIFFLWPHEFFAANKAMGNLSLVGDAAFIIAVFCMFRWERFAAGKTIILFALACIEAFLGAEFLSAKRKHVAAFLATALLAFIHFVTFVRAEFFTVFAEGSSTSYAKEGFDTFRHLTFLVMSGLGVQGGHRPKVTGLSAGHESALAHGIL